MSDCIKNNMINLKYSRKIIRLFYVSQLIDHSLVEILFIECHKLLQIEKVFLTSSRDLFELKLFEICPSTCELFINNFSGAGTSLLRKALKG